MDTIRVSNRREFIDEVMSRDIDGDEVPLSKEGADELWNIWDYRLRNGAGEYLVISRNWLAEEKFGRQWPCMFANVEYDDESKAAVLFRDGRIIDHSIIENQVWSEVPMNDVLDTVEIESDHIDEKGKCWMPRSQMIVFEVVDDD